MLKKPNNKSTSLLFLAAAMVFIANAFYSLRDLHLKGLLCSPPATIFCSAFQKLSDLQAWRASLTIFFVFILILLSIALVSSRVHHRKKNLQHLLGGGILSLICHFSIEWIAASHDHLLYAAVSRISYLILLSALVTAAILSIEKEEPVSKEASISRLSAKPVISTLIVSTLTLISGTISTMFPPGRSCGLWPLCSERFLPSDPGEWIYLIHMINVGLTALFLTRLMIHTWREHKTEAHILAAGTLSFTLFLGEIMIGAFQVNQTQPAGLMLLHAQTSISVWTVLMVLFGFVLQAGQEKRVDKHIAAAKYKFVWKNFFQITKPLIVLLLLFTTFTGMATASGGMPDFSLTFITLLAGGLAAGGSGAINQYIDRHLDRQMKRTSQRPIASGKIFPAEGLAFGLGLLVISFYLMARFVNMTAALLSGAGMLYYLLAYSLILKRRTTWNIVIGGGAGAIPPLVGWAAVQGQLDLFAWGLFLIVLLWTPTHFWSLALVRENEYASVNIPMLPVVKGRKRTTQVILGSTILLVAFTWFFAIWKTFNWVYPVTAVLAGLVLLYYAVRLWQRDDNHIAHLVYRCSNIYLGMLFFSMILDSIAF